MQHWLKSHLIYRRLEMKLQDFSSSLAQPLMDFIKLKQLAGYDYTAQANLLSHFDRYLMDQKYKQSILTEQIALNYLASIKHRSPRSLENVHGLLRIFSRWLFQHSKKSYVLDDFLHKEQAHSRPTYIFDDKQILSILNACDKLPKTTEKVSGIYRTLFSLLYTTGIRIGEALNLNHEDVSTSEKLIHIRKGKFSKERYLVLSPTMSRLLESYSCRCKARGFEQKDDSLFVGMRGRRLIYNSAQAHLKSLLRMAKISDQGKNGPNLYSFRHTFAVHRLLKWYETECDINAKLPFLSTYMGHVNILSTQVYLHATNELLWVGADRFHSLFSKIVNKGEGIQ